MLTVVPLAASVATMSPIVPRPVEYARQQGAFEFSWDTEVIYADGLQSEAEHLARFLRSATGFPVPTIQGSQGDGNDVLLRIARARDLDPLGEEGYRLEVEPRGIAIEGATPAGVFYGIQTLKQMLPAEALRRSDQPRSWQVPDARVVDWPRFSWRGMHLDVSRHFFPPEFLKRFLDLMALYKFNVFHWHLVDDGGWRMESLRYPLLTERGAWRDAPKRGEWSQAALSFPERRDGDEYGGYYTRREIREIVAYAASLHITVVPEIEMPGHTLPSIVCYPELACDPPGANQNVYCAGSEKTFEFLENILEETLDLFPSKYIHIGGDEVYKGWWANCQRCQARMKRENLQTLDELQSYFIRRMDAFLTKHGRTLIGWDEILEGGLAPNASVMSWRGVEGGIEAVRQNRHAVMCPTSHCYFDYSYATTPTEEVYEFDPVPDEIPEGAAHLILGAQGNLWTEWMPTEDRVLYMAFPRALALAEAVWTPKERKDLEGFLARLNEHYARLDALRVPYRLPSPVPAGPTLTFDDTMTVAFAPAPPGMVIRYTTDGTPPTRSSTRYQKSFAIRAGTVLRAAMFTLDGEQPSDEIRVACVSPKGERPADFVPGIQYSTYLGSWSRLPDFSRLSPTEKGVTDRVGVHVKPREEQYGIRFEGFLEVVEDGEYEFRLGSDDGSVLRIAGATVVDHDGLHAYVERSVRVKMKRGVYPFVLDFFEQGGADSVSLRIEGPAPVRLLRSRD